MKGALIIVILLAFSLLPLFILYFIAKQFYNIACEKGFLQKRYFWIPFLLGIIGYMLVIALPDRSNHAIYASNIQTENAQRTSYPPSQNISISKDELMKAKYSDYAQKQDDFVFFETRLPRKGEWRCQVCGRINYDYVGTCACGERKTN